MLYLRFFSAMSFKSAFLTSSGVFVRKSVLCLCQEAASSQLVRLCPSEKSCDLSDNFYPCLHCFFLSITGCETTIEFSAACRRTRVLVGEWHVWCTFAQSAFFPFCTIFLLSVIFLPTTSRKRTVFLLTPSCTATRPHLHELPDSTPCSIRSN